MAGMLDGLGLDRAHIVASSFGGFLALMSTAAAPERTLRMVQMACPAFVPGMSAPGFMKAMSLRPVRWLTNMLPPNETVGRSILRQIGHGASLDSNRVPQIFFERYLALQRHTNTMRHEGEMIGRAAPLRGFPPEAHHSRRRAPIDHRPDAVPVGRGRPARHRRCRTSPGRADAARLIKDALPAAGHLPWIDDFEGTGRATADFLAAPDLRAAEKEPQAL
jgi:pimeloyl-ACP methyl ester carboxylesterase